MPRYATLEFSDQYFASFASREFSDADRRRLICCMRLLDDNDRHPSLRVHDLRGDLAGLWSASASDQLRIIFRRLPNGKKKLITSSRHDGD